MRIMSAGAGTDNLLPEVEGAGLNPRIHRVARGLDRPPRHQALSFRRETMATAKSSPIRLTWIAVVLLATSG